MKARLIALAVWYILLGAFVLVTSARAEASGPVIPAEWTSAPHLTQVVRAQSGVKRARVYCGYRQLGALGEAWKPLGIIALSGDTCRALRSLVVAPPYPRSSTGEAVFTLAHEAGHLVTPGGTMAESQADCYAARTWKRYARALGYDASKLTTSGECWR